MPNINELPQKELIKLYLELLISTKKVITPEIKKKLTNLGFEQKKLGSRKCCEIQSREIKIDFLDYDFAIGLAERPGKDVDHRNYQAMILKKL